MPLVIDWDWINWNNVFHLKFVCLNYVDIGQVISKPNILAQCHVDLGSLSKILLKKRISLLGDWSNFCTNLEYFLNVCNLILGCPAAR